MTKITEDAHPVHVTPQMLAAMRQGEADREWLADHPDVLDPFRGQWVVVHNRRVVAHSPDGREVAAAASTSRYPGALLEYVPSREEAEAVHLYTPIFHASARDDGDDGVGAGGKGPSSR
jgi:hypothetical protein